MLPFRRSLTFEEVVLPHLDAGFALACHLLRNDADAEDVTQQASLKALKNLDAFRGENARAWFLAIVRNVAWSSLRTPARRGEHVEFDDSLHHDARENEETDAAVIRASTHDAVHRALGALPAELREVITLRELEDCSYRDIATIVDVPIGTVMSRLSRARRQLAVLLGSRNAT